MIAYVIVRERLRQVEKWCSVTKGGPDLYAATRNWLRIIVVHWFRLPLSILIPILVFQTS